MLLKENKNFNKILQLINSEKYEEAKDELINLENSCNSDFIFYDLLAQICEKLNLQKEAISYYEKSLFINNDFYQSKFNLAILHYKLKNFNKSEELFFQIISTNKNDFNSYYNLGVIKYDQKQFSDAILFLQKAISLKKDSFISHHHLAMCYEAMRKFDLAIQVYKKAITLDKVNSSISLNNLGNIYLELKDFERAVFFFQKALNYKGKKSSIYFNLGIANFGLNKIFESLSFFEKAIDLDPKNLKFITTLLGTSHFLEQNSSYYKKYLNIFRDAIEFHDSSLFHKYSYLNESPLKIGILSRGLRQYPTGYFLLDLIKKLYVKKSFQLHAFYDFDSEDQYSKELKQNFHYWHDVSSLTDVELINLIRKSEINILIDMQGHTYDNRLQIFVEKPAPVQVSWAAYLASSGIPEIDYILGDPNVTPYDHKNLYIEKIYQLPNIWCPLSTSDLSEINLKQRTADENIVFGCFNNIKKINKDVIFAWSQILKNTSNSKLYLKSNEFNNLKFKENFVENFEKLGVLKEKLILENQSERKELLECYNKIDIALDTFPYTGGTTNLELSYMCVPLITISGETFLSRCGASVNKNLGMNELIAKSLDEYVEIAINLAKDKNKLSMIKAELLKNSRKSKLFDIEIFSRDFTNAMQDMWKNFLHHNSNIKK